MFVVIAVGCGSAVWAPLAADISRVTDSSERTGLLSIMMSVRESGMILGTGYSVILYTSFTACRYQIACLYLVIASL